MMCSVNYIICYGIFVIFCECFCNALFIVVFRVNWGFLLVILVIIIVVCMCLNVCVVVVVIVVLDFWLLFSVVKFELWLELWER